MRIFGYGSLLSATAINEHKLGPDKITEDALQEATLKNYDRSFNAVDGRFRYLGISRKNGSSCNGVIFNLLEKELDRFGQVEGVSQVYDLKDVSKDITPHHDGPVYALVTIAPSHKGVIPADYLQQVRGALKHRSKSFQHRFNAETAMPSK